MHLKTPHIRSNPVHDEVRSGMSTVYLLGTDYLVGTWSHGLRSCKSRCIIRTSVSRAVEEDRNIPAALYPGMGLHVFLVCCDACELDM
uniref:Uncharacterized protein n=1 Tax=Oryza meridionalis TaxID=40149 RepID=A0A0E0DII7_9ORYZ